MELRFEGKFTEIGRKKGQKRGSIAVVIPAVGADAVGIKKGDKFAITISDKEIIIRKA